MKNYTVQQISQMLKTNPETVRRWIRAEKLPAVKGSRKSGNLVSEEELKKFMLETPKYAGMVAALFAPMPVAIPMALGGFLTSIVGAIYGSKKEQVTPQYVEDYLRNEIARYEKSIAQKKKTIAQLQTELANDEQQLTQYKYALDHLDIPALATEVNESLKRK